MMPLSAANHLLFVFRKDPAHTEREAQWVGWAAPVTSSPSRVGVSEQSEKQIEEAAPTAAKDNDREDEHVLSPLNKDVDPAPLALTRAP